MGRDVGGAPENEEEIEGGRDAERALIAVSLSSLESCLECDGF